MSAACSLGSSCSTLYLWQWHEQFDLWLQANHFVRYAPDQIEYAKNRYVNETNRLYQVHKPPSGQISFFSNKSACCRWPLNSQLLALDTLRMSGSKW